jgi:hypothetical protein
MKYTARCLVVTLGLMLGMVFMAPADKVETTGLLGTWVLAAAAVTLIVATLEVLGLMGRVLEFLARWRR